MIYIVFLRWYKVGFCNMRPIMLSEEKVYELIKIELRLAKRNNFCRTLILQIIKYCNFFDKLRITSADIARNLKLSKSAYSQIALARTIYPDLIENGLDIQQL